MRCAPALSLVLLALSLACPPALAWSALGHRLVAELAQRHVQPSTGRAIRTLLAGEPEPTLAGVADWADQLRDEDPAYFRATARWHYVNLGPGCSFDPPRDCPGGQCIVGAIANECAILADSRESTARRRQALKFLVHLVADVHQPLHAGGRDDKGGNRFQVSLRTALPPPAFARERYADGVMGTNLHAIWDYYVLATPHLSATDYAMRLGALPWPPRGSDISSPAAWAAESCRMAATIYPAAHAMDRVYLDARRPQAEQRVRLAAYRLARLLDTALGSTAR